MESVTTFYLGEGDSARIHNPRRLLSIFIVIFSPRTEPPVVIHRSGRSISRDTLFMLLGTGSDLSHLLIVPTMFNLRLARILVIQVFHDNVQLTVNEGLTLIPYDVFSRLKRLLIPSVVADRVRAVMHRQREFIHRFVGERRRVTPLMPSGDHTISGNMTVRS